MWDLVTGEKIQILDGLYLIGSSLGWLLAGRQPDQENSANGAWLSVAAWYAGAPNDWESEVLKTKKADQDSMDISFMWDLETLGINDRPEDPGDEEVLKKFNETVACRDNRYFVTWPWKEEEVKLPSNYRLALGWLNSLLQKYKSDPAIFKQYHQVINDQLQKGVIELVDEKIPTKNRLHYIPHQAVITPGRTTKLRVVYDASTKVNKEYKSLNECLYSGPVILDDIVAILIRFRLNKIAIASDIVKAFLQVGLEESERDVTRFLWLRNPEVLSTENNIQVYRFKRVPFGFTSSPFLLGASIQYHLRKNGGEIAMNILRNIYVDNIITGVENEEKAIQFYNTTKSLFKAATMNVREWMSNSEKLMNSIPNVDRARGSSKVLGMPWNPGTDQLSFRIPEATDLTVTITKRSILRYLATCFDPMGLICPAILQGKLLLQRLWKEKLIGMIRSPEISQKNGNQSHLIYKAYPIFRLTDLSAMGCHTNYTVFAMHLNQLMASRCICS